MTIFTTTQAEAEEVMVLRVGKFMIAAGLDGLTSDGTNVDLQDPYNTALRHFGYASISSLEDADEESEFLVVMELRVLSTILTNYDDVDIKVGDRFIAFNQLAVRARQRYNDLLETAKEVYGIGERELIMGVFKTDINETPEA